MRRMPAGSEGYVDKKRSLNDLLGEDEELASFHDASLLAVHVDYTQNRWVAEFDICVGDPESSDHDQRERRRRGQLTIEGLKVWILEAPSQVPSNHKEGLWLTDDGPLNELQRKRGNGSRWRSAPTGSVGGYSSAT